MDKKEVLALVREYLYDDSLSDDEMKKIVLNLYSKYSKLERIINKNENYINKLSNLEDEIYYINDNSLTDIEKIQLEINYYKDSKDKNISKRVQSLIELIKGMIDSKDFSNEELLTIKQRLVEIQILANDEITFYEAAYKLFKDYCYDIKEQLGKKK